MKFTYPAFFLFLTAVLPVLHSYPAQAAELSCEAAATLVEQSLDIPHGLLTAIGKIESGNNPLAVNAGGTPVHFERTDLAVDAVRLMLQSGAFGTHPRLDVGCFQVNLGWHAAAFRSVESSFDPVVNGLVAGQFLRRLHAETGDWHSAVARYHAASEEGERYALAVFRTYENGGTPLPVSGKRARISFVRVADRAALRHRYIINYRNRKWTAAASDYGITIFEPDTQSAAKGHLRSRHAG